MASLPAALHAFRTMPAHELYSMNDGDVTLSEELLPRLRDEVLDWFSNTATHDDRTELISSDNAYRMFCQNFTSPSASDDEDAMVRFKASVIDEMVSAYQKV